jgi:Sulfotransferase family
VQSNPQCDPSETAGTAPSHQHAIDFLGIGAQKAGTTWLWSTLRKHPGIWMPPLKELHYWDRSSAYPSPSFLASNQLRQRLFGREDHNRDFRRQCWRQLRSALARRDWPVLRWQLRYYFGTYDDEWYLSLFAEGRNAICGEITPSYSILDAPDVARVRKLLPNLKVIYLLRNPVDRAWSQIRFEWTRGRFVRIDDLDGIKAFIEDPAQTLRGDYVRTLDLWGASFPKKQIYVGFYDDISTRPNELLHEILTFLGAATDWPITPEEIRQKVLVSAEVSMPKEIGRYLARKYLPAVEELSARFAGAPEQWRREIAAMP